MIEACIFDLDGTLIDSEILWVEAIEVALARKELAMARDDVAALVYGRSWPDIYADIRRMYPDMYPTRESMEAVTVPVFKALQRTRDIRIHASVQLLLDLSERFPIGIVSGSTRDRIAESMALLGIEDRIKAHVGCEDYAEGKPSPAGFLLGASLLGVAPEACLVFEDSAAGVAAAKRAGMACVALRRENAGGQDLSKADAVLDSFADFDIDAFLAQYATHQQPCTDDRTRRARP
jgi:beta-phosphoglucomutase-like phosphatase (HAD superfamily)